MSSNGFILDVDYENTEESGALTNYIPEGNLEGIPLIKIINVDQLNQQMDNQSDGLFDFIEGITARASTGRFIFHVLEPFGSYLSDQFTDPLLAEKYSYQALYDSSITIAQQYPELNKFRLKGSYQSSSGAEIRLNAMNVPEGSVTVTAGSQKLIENQDYTVDYMLGKVTIINEGILSSGIPIKISLENNSMFGIQNKDVRSLVAPIIDNYQNKPGKVSWRNKQVQVIKGSKFKLVSKSDDEYSEDNVSIYCPDQSFFKSLFLFAPRSKSYRIVPIRINKKVVYNILFRIPEQENQVLIYRSSKKKICEEKLEQLKEKFRTFNNEGSSITSTPSLDNILLILCLRFIFFKLYNKCG